MPLETVTVTITGANPQVKTVQVNVDASTGAGSSTLQYNGTNGGLDTIKATATIAGGALTSNTGSVAWQAFSAAAGVCLGPVAFHTFKNPGDHTTWHGTGTDFGIYNGQTVIYNQPVNNTPIFGIVDPNGRTGEYFDTIPMWANEVKADGTALGGTNWPGVNLGHTGHSFVEIITFNIVVKSTNATFYFLVDDSWAMYIGGGATRHGGSSNSMVLQPNGSSPATPSTYNGLPLLGTRNTSAQNIQPADTVQVTFPGPGVYPVVFWWINNDDDQGYFQCTAVNGIGAIATTSGSAPGTVLLPVAIQGSAPATTPSGNLQLSIASGTTPLVANSQTVTVNISVSGIHYSVEPYIPLLEGTQGHLFLYNSLSAPTFTYPTYNGQPVDKAAAVSSSAINLSGDNSSWVGRLLPSFDGTNLAVSYNGSGFDSHVDITHLSVNSDDVSWFDSSDKTFDLFTITAGNGGLQLGITVDYMVSAPTAGMTVTPSSVTADGASHTFTLALPKPISPRQQGTQFGTGNTFGISSVFVGANAASSVTPILDASGWLTGWHVTAIVTHSTSNGSLHVTGTVSGTLTYLNGTVFTTGTVTYASGNLGNLVTTVGVSFSPPTNYSFSPPASFTGSITLTATVFATDSGAMTMNFIRQLSGVNTTIGAGTKTAGPTAVSGGFTTTFSITVTSTFAWGTPIHFGYTATDTLSSLAVTFISSTASNNLNPNPGGGGGGGGGCPAVEMFIDEWHQCSDVFVGMGVETLQGETEQYLSSPILTEPQQVQRFDYSTEPCHHFVAENGAEVIVSASTPVPTRGAIEMLADGHETCEVPIFANEVTVGMFVITDIGNGPEWSVLVEASAVGMRRVVRLYCGGRNYAAGVKPGKYIFTHNLLIVK